MVNIKSTFTGILALSTISSNVAYAQSIKPNILFIAVDDLKPLLGCYGDPLAKTPNMDILASRGTIFTSGYCQVALSGPTRASLLTGMYPDEVNIRVAPDYITADYCRIFTMSEMKRFLKLLRIQHLRQTR